MSLPSCWGLAAGGSACPGADGGGSEATCSPPDKMGLRAGTGAAAIFFPRVRRRACCLRCRVGDLLAGRGAQGMARRQRDIAARHRGRRDGDVLALRVLRGTAGGAGEGIRVVKPIGHQRERTGANRSGVGGISASLAASAASWAARKAMACWSKAGTRAGPSIPPMARRPPMRRRRRRRRSRLRRRGSAKACAHDAMHRPVLRRAPARGPGTGLRQTTRCRS